MHSWLLAAYCLLHQHIHRSSSHNVAYCVCTYTGLRHTTLHLHMHRSSSHNVAYCISTCRDLRHAALPTTSAHADIFVTQRCLLHLHMQRSSSHNVASAHAEIFVTQHCLLHQHMQISSSHKLSIASTHCLWLYIWWFFCQKYRMSTVYIWSWPNPNNKCCTQTLSNACGSKCTLTWVPE